MTEANPFDSFIAPLPSWQRDICTKARRLIHEVEPDIEETIKFRNRPYFVLKGNVCALLPAKQHVNIFIYDPIASDPGGIINQGHENKTARSIQVREGDDFDEQSFQKLIRAVCDNNRAGGWRHLIRISSDHKSGQAE